MSNTKRRQNSLSNDINPLEFYPVSLALKRKSLPINERGRPTLAKVIKFSPQPKSLLITKFINQMKKEELQENGTSDFEGIEPVVISTQLNLPKNTTKQFSCDYPECSYTCKLSCNLIKHKRTHTAEKPFLCDQCTFRTNFVNSLKVHKRTHTTERPFSCNYCSYRCNSSSNLKKHHLHKHPEVPKT